MSPLIVEATVDTPMLSESLEAAPGVAVFHEEQYSIDDGVKYIFWAEGDGLDDFDEALDRDPTVTGQRVLAETEGRRLYRVTTTAIGCEAVTFPTWAELDLFMLDSWADHRGLRTRIQVPDRNTLAEFLEVCRDRGLSITVEAIYEGAEVDDELPAGLTTRQREALVCAVEVGYFDVPRSASLDDVSDCLGVSTQAASERIRRGTAALVEATFVPRTS